MKCGVNYGLLCHPHIPAQWKHSTLINEDAQTFLERETHSAKGCAGLHSQTPRIFKHTFPFSVHALPRGQVLSEEVCVSVTFFLKKSLAGHHKTMTMIAAFYYCAIWLICAFYGRARVVKSQENFQMASVRVCKYGRRDQHFLHKARRAISPVGSGTSRVIAGCDNNERVLYTYTDPLSQPNFSVLNACVLFGERRRMGAAAARRGPLRTHSAPLTNSSNGRASRNLIRFQTNGERRRLLREWERLRICEKIPSCSTLAYMQEMLLALLNNYFWCFIHLWAYGPLA